MSQKGTSDTTWRNLGIPYVLTNNVSVYKDTTTPATLTIEPGVEVRFAQWKRLSVGTSASKGALIAQGTQAAPIVFTSNQTTKTPGYWYELRFEGGAQATSLLEYVTVEYGGGGNVGELYVGGSSPTIRNTTVRKSSNHGVYVTGTAGIPILDTVSLEDNGSTGIYVASGGMSLKDMTSSGTGGSYAVSMPANTSVTSTGVHSFDKPIELRYALISQDTTWPNLGAPYVSPANVYVYKNATTTATLTIESGVEVRFNQYKYFYVGWSSYKGDLSARGTAAAPIVLTSNQTVKTPGFWGRIELGSAVSPATVLEHAVVEYGGYGGQGNVRVLGSPAIQNTSIRDSSNYGVYVAGTTAFPTLKDNNFVNNPTYAVYNTTANGIDARASWWNDASGPSGVGPGGGGAVSANVLYTPWLEAPQNPYFFAGDAQVTRTTFNKHQEDTAVIATLSGPGDWVLEVVDSVSSVLRTTTGSGTTVNQAWAGEQDGTTDKVPDGTYTLRLTATETATGQVMSPLVANVTVEGGAGDPNLPLGIISDPGPGAVVRGGDAVSVTGTAKDANDFVSYRVDYGEGISPSVWTVITSPPDVTTPVENGVLATWATASLNGSTYTLRLKVKDATSPEATTQVTVNVLTIKNLTSSETHISPNGDLMRDTTTFTATMTVPSDWSLRVEDGAQATVRTFTGSGTGVNVIWDGKDESGTVVPEGAYTYILDATEPGSGVQAVPKSGTITVDLTGPTAQITAPIQ
ncbi:MAG: hypothetical protein ACE5JI_08125, partial [Acidobacteriota bacterium]